MDTATRPQGRMSKARMANTMPLDSPIYPEPPYHYRNVERLVFSYETDQEAALDLLPDCLDLHLPATVSVVFLDIPTCTLGAYHEAFVGLRASFEGTPVEYVVWNLLTSDAAVTVGREIWGVPKKLAHVAVEKHPEGMVGIVERPAGVRICTALVRPERVMAREESAPFALPLVCVRIIPDPAGGEPLIELIDHFNPATNNFEVEDDWWKNQIRGTGSVNFDARSAIDPWHKLPVVKMLDAFYSGGRSSFDLPYGKVLKRY